MGLTLPPGAFAAFETFGELLERRRNAVNLTAITGVENVARLHFLDCIALTKAYDFKDKGVIDVGSGAGFPGMPIKIAEPSVGLTLLDATGKRVAFLSELCLALGIAAECVQARAEEAARDAKMRERFDVAVSRAVARLNVLCELCLPYVRVGGAFIAMKSADSDDELAEAGGAMETLGAMQERIFTYTIPGADIVRRAVIIRKISPTPGEYPRRFARIQKSPLS